MTDILRLEGNKSPLKRLIASLAATSEPQDDDPFTSPWHEYRKTTTIFASQMKVPFEVNTIEGLHSAKAGDWLAVGVEGELYPIDAEVFTKSYEEVAK